MDYQTILIRTFLLAGGLVVFSSGLSAQDAVRIAGVEQSPDSEATAVIIAEAYRRIGTEMEVEWLNGLEALKASNSGALDGELQRIDGINRT